MQFKLIEGNGLAALAEADMGFLCSTRRFGEATNTVGSLQTLIATTDELSWIDGDITAAIRPMNRSIAMIWAGEEAEMLSYSDVAAAERQRARDQADADFEAMMQAQEMPLVQSKAGAEALNELMTRPPPPRHALPKPLPLDE